MRDQIIIIKFGVTDVNYQSKRWLWFPSIERSDTRTVSYSLYPHHSVMINPILKISTPGDHKTNLDPYPPFITPL